MKLYRFIFIIFCLLCWASAAASSLSITEIMYDLEGSDSAREWIEIYNNSGSSIDLTKYKFFESGSAHNITHYQGSSDVANGEYVVIADNPTNFLNDNPNFPKSNLYDSSFSLANDVGENLAIKDANGNIVFEITYNVDLGANGDGKTLQQNNSGSWTADLPTPGKGLNSNTQNNSILNNNVDNTNNSNTNNTNKNTITGGTAFIPYSKDPTMQLNIESLKTNIVGKFTNFKPILYGYGGENISQGTFIWNFGDGQTVTVDSNKPIDHIYNFPGNYIVSCSYKYASWYPKTVVTGKTKISIVDSPIILKELYLSPSPAVLIVNTKDDEYDISGYIIQTNNQNITIPEGTYIGAKDSIVINLPIGVYTKDKVKILAPSGYTTSSLLVDKIPNNNNADITKPKINNSNILSFSNPNNQDYLKNNDIYNDTDTVALDTDSHKTSKNNTKIYIGLFLVIVIFGFLIYFLRKNSLTTNQNELDDYILQDE